MVKLVHSFAFLAAAAQFVNGLTLTADAITLLKEKYSHQENLFLEEISAKITALASAYGLVTNHTLSIDLNSTHTINGIDYTPGTGLLAQARIDKYAVSISTDNVTWTTAASGTWLDDPSTKYAGFPDTKARFVKLIAITETGVAFPWDERATIWALDAPTSTAGGQWGSMIALPLVPAGAFLRPDVQITTFASYRANEFNNYPDYEPTITNNTYTAKYDPVTGAITEFNVTWTDHDMFCPGLSLDFDGRAIVSGGDTSKKTSIYDQSISGGIGNWTANAEMQLGRGYQAQTTLSDGRIWTIGGAWSGGIYLGKRGEIYNTSTNTWTNLTGCAVEPMLTNDAQGIYRQDSHGWLFAWSNASIFQAGSSTKMNWYFTDGNGSYVSAGDRNGAPDQMNGNAVMYEEGKIFTVGGSPSYQYSNATNLAHHIDITFPGALPHVTTIAPMNFARAFANSVVLPNGKVFITGGQTIAVPFTDSNAILTPEVWDPVTQTYEILPAQHTVERNYHSVALLMQDGRIFTGGAGLCGPYATNHQDAQINSPSYLFTSSGSLAARPNITSISNSTIVVGGTFSITTDVEVDRFAITRYGSNTYTMNTDQRRLVLEPNLYNGTKRGCGNGTRYSLTLPSDPAVLLPVYWMVWAMDVEGVVSESASLKVVL